MKTREFGTLEVARALPFSRLIPYMERELLKPVTAPLRISIGGGNGRELLVMPAVSERFSGVKILTIVPANSTNGSPVNGGLFILFDAMTGAALAMLDASELTARRTAAVSALASGRLARQDADSLLIIGSGHLAPYLAEAHAQVRDIRSISVWGRRHDRSEACAAAIRTRLPNVQVDCIENLESAVRNSDIISAATRTREPLIQGTWLSQGTHVDLVGGYRPDMREIDDAGIARARLYVDTREGVLAEAGDFISPLARHVITESAIIGDIASLLNGAGRGSEREITLFKAVGTAISDLTAAQLLWEIAGE